MKSFIFSIFISLLIVPVIHGQSQQESNKVAVLDGIDDMIETVFDLSGAPKDNFSIEVWVKPSAPINLPDQGGTGNNNHGGIIYPEEGRSIAQFDGHKNAGVGLSVGNNGVVVFIQPKIYGGPYHQKVALLVHRADIDKWTHVAVVFTGRQPVLYLDGKFAARGITGTVQLWLWPRQIGGNHAGFGNFSGMLDELCLWNRSLGFQEIENHSKEPVKGSESGMILYYDFNRIDGDGTFPDMSYKGHKGMLMNGISIEDQPPVFLSDAAPALESKPVNWESDLMPIDAGPGLARPDGIAVIIGIEKYKDAPDAAFAKNDALIFRKYAGRQLGIPEENIYMITDEEATLGEFMKLFGKNGYLDRRSTDKTDIFIYYSGHGAPDFETKIPYLIPYDIDPDYPSTGYSTRMMYENLSSFKARSITVFLDACFSGSTRSDEMLLADARPVRIEMEPSAIPENINLLTASSGAQISSGFPDRGHGLFSYYLMKGMTELSDSNGDNKVTLGELYDYIYANVTRTAVKLDREQTPQMISSRPNQIVCSF